MFPNNVDGVRKPGFHPPPNLVSGAKTRLSDTSSVYVEDRYQNGSSLSGFTHATGINLTAKERWNLGGSGEFGKLRDSQTGAETDRKAAGIRLGSIGSKYAYRLGQASLDRVQRNFFDNAAQLAVFRVDWRFLKQWESLAEVRTLDLPDVSQRRSGALADLSSHWQEPEGWRRLNFTDSSDELKYNHKGVFLNLIGTK